MKILDAEQIRRKTVRLAYEILEHNHTAPRIVMAGINRNGMAFARMLHAELARIAPMPIELTNVRLNPADPLATPVEIDLAPEALRDQVVIVVDDVANTGRTIFYACKPLLTTLPRKVEVAVLVDRTHKTFPVKVDYVGLSLATTLLEHIDVRLRDADEPAAFLT